MSCNGCSALHGVNPNLKKNSASFAKQKYIKWLQNLLWCSECKFKFRYNNHTKSFNRYYEHDTELSKYIWKLKDLGKAFILKWSIAAYASPCRCGTRHCDLCITEKYIIARADQKRLLNKRTEFISKCRHRNKFLLRNVK